MAHAALGNGFCAQGQMFKMARTTTNLVPVFAAIGFDVGRLFVVALDTIGVLQFHGHLFGLENFLILIAGLTGYLLGGFIGSHSWFGLGTTPKTERRNCEDGGTK